MPFLRWAAASGPGVAIPLPDPPLGEGLLVLMIGGWGEPVFLTLNGTQKSWARTGNFRPGAKEFLDSLPSGVKVYPNQGSSTALLPIRLPGSAWGYGNGSAIQVGGWAASPGATASNPARR